MTGSSRFARISLTSARWLLPWIALLFVSVTLAYAMGSATHEGFLFSDQGAVHAASSTAKAAAETDVEQPITSMSETTLDPSGGRFEVMSISSPASTGHASPNGCCTWD
jgi:hypothetical protein